MTWLIIAGIVAGWALGIIATVVWFRWMEARHDRAFAERERRLNSGKRSRGSKLDAPLSFGYSRRNAHVT
jgi:hypothetical protein